MKMIGGCPVSIDPSMTIFSSWGGMSIWTSLVQENKSTDIKNREVKSGSKFFILKFKIPGYTWYDREEGYLFNR